MIKLANVNIEHRNGFSVQDLCYIREFIKAYGCYVLMGWPANASRCITDLDVLVHRAGDCHSPHNMYFDSHDSIYIAIRPCDSSIVIWCSRTYCSLYCMSAAERLERAWENEFWSVREINVLKTCWLTIYKEDAEQAIGWKTTAVMEFIY